MTLGKVGVLAAGYGVAATVGASIEDAKKFQTEVARFAAMGFGDKITDQATKFAKGMDIMGMSYTENMALIREATVVTGSPETAMMMAPALGKFQAGITAYMGQEQGEKASRMMLDLYKTAELRGHAMNPVQLQEELDAAAKVYISTGGLVQPRDLFNFIKTGGVAAKGLSTEAFYFRNCTACRSWRFPLRHVPHEQFPEFGDGARHASGHQEPHGHGAARFEHGRLRQGERGRKRGKAWRSGRCHQDDE